MRTAEALYVDALAVTVPLYAAASRPRPNNILIRKVATTRAGLYRAGLHRSATNNSELRLAESEACLRASRLPMSGVLSTARLRCPGRPFPLGTPS